MAMELWQRGLESEGQVDASEGSRCASCRTRANWDYGGMPVFVCAYWTVLMLLDPARCRSSAGKAKTRRDADRGQQNASDFYRRSTISGGYWFEPAVLATT
jgi:hypothetical protein